MDSRLRIFSLGFLAFLSATNVVAAEGEGEDDATHWGYEGDLGVAHWGRLDRSFHLCEDGQLQSPINIQNPIEAKLPALSLSYRPFALKIVDNGHTIEVRAPTSPYDKGGSTVKNIPEYGFRVEHHSYRLLQLHFHTPSEDEIEGKAYPLEAHFVHKRDDGQFGVIGVVFKKGKANAELEKILQNMPDKAGEEKDILDERLDITKLLPKDKSYYRFMGSLTTPPCSEGVNWYILEQPITVSETQIKAFQKIFPMNARPVQLPHNRLIVKDQR